MVTLTAVAALVGVLVGYLRGGSLERLAEMRVRWPWLVAVAFGVQVALFASPLAGALDPWAAPLHLGSVALVALVVVANRHLPGLAVVGLGLALNAAVYAANGGFMPAHDDASRAAGVSEAAIARRHALGRNQKTFSMDADTPLWVLGDVVPIRPLGKAYSPGDLVAGVGLLLLVAGGMGARRRPTGEVR